MHDPETLKALFQPDSVAVIGASATPGKIGNIVVANMIAAGYRGKLVPVNPKGGDIHGLTVAPDIASLPHPLDLAVVCLPPAKVAACIDDLGSLPTRAAIIITAGFREVGRGGYELEQEVVRAARRHGMAVLGPNCLGLINTTTNVNATFASEQPLPGRIAFFSQSGAMCVTILDWALGQNIGFSSFISLGNKALLDESDILDYLARDPATKVILGYSESIENGRRFVRMARDVVQAKPVIMIKAGSTSAGARAASSHTGAIAGSMQAYTAAFRQAGVIQVERMEHLFELAQAFSSQPLPEGPNLCVITNSGGPGILTADACERSGLNLVRPGPASLEKLREFLPSFAAMYNPIDIIGDADHLRYARTLDVMADDPMVHALLVLLSPTAAVAAVKVAEVILKKNRSCPKPIFTCFMGEKSVGDARKLLRNSGVPCYDFPEPAVASIDAMYSYFRWRNNPPAVDVCFRRDKGRAERLIDQARKKGLTELVEFQAQQLLAAYELPHPPTLLARTSEQAATAARKIGFPVVLKIASPQISHKTDVGGVVTGLNTPAEAAQAFMDITYRAARMQKGAYIQGCLVQAMAPKGAKEVIIGFTRDHQFGPLMMFGLGGIYVEVLKDISFRLAPLTLADAADMVREIRSFPLLRGMRGEKPVDFKALEDILLTLSQVAMDFPEIAEADLNPVLVNHEGALVADVRLALD